MPCLHTQRLEHFLSMAELILGVLNIIYSKTVIIYPVRLRDDSIHQSTEAERGFLITELHTRMKEVFQFSEVRVADLTAVIIFIRIVIHGYLAFISSTYSMCSSLMNSGLALSFALFSQ